MAKVKIETNRHVFEIPDDCPGIKRKVTLSNFLFSTGKTSPEQFSVTLTVDYLLPKRVDILDENDQPTGEYKYVNDLYEDEKQPIVIGQYSDTFVGDRQIMVYYDKENPSHPRTGEILNPDRKDVKLLGYEMDENGEDLIIPYTSQYEFVYDMFTGICPPLALIRGLINNWNGWKSLSSLQQHS